jgi:hypothetical protein
MLALLRTRRRRCRGGILDYRWAAFWKSLDRPGRMADSIEQMGWLLSISRRRAASRDRTEESLRFFTDGAAKKWPLRGSLKLG